MPIYEYQCQSCGNGHEALQKMSAEPLMATHNSFLCLLNVYWACRCDLSVPTNIIFSLISTPLSSLTGFGSGRSFFTGNIFSSKCQFMNTSASPVEMGMKPYRK
jgi:hypothetical protein